MWNDWLKRNYSPSCSPSTERLEEILLQYGGENVILRNVIEDITLSRLLDEGDVVEFSAVENKWRHNETTRSNECHFNASAVWAWHQDNGHEDVELVYGFGLTDDGTWREHSFCFDPTSKTIHETTVVREMYFGVQLQFEEARSFANGEGVFLQSRG